MLKIDINMKSITDWTHRCSSNIKCAHNALVLTFYWNRDSMRNKKESQFIILTFADYNGEPSGKYFVESIHYYSIAVGPHNQTNELTILIKYFDCVWICPKIIFILIALIVHSFFFIHFHGHPQGHKFPTMQWIIWICLCKLLGDSDECKFLYNIKYGTKAREGEVDGGRGAGKSSNRQGYREHQEIQSVWTMSVNCKCHHWCPIPCCLSSVSFFFLHGPYLHATKFAVHYICI